MVMTKNTVIVAMVMVHCDKSSGYVKYKFS